MLMAIVVIAGKLPRSPDFAGLSGLFLENLNRSPGRVEGDSSFSNIGVVPAVAVELAGVVD
jgi:hypothetical protein